jgi:ABC-2 type transport system ATP-binding protein
VYRVPEREAGLWAAVRSVVRRTTRAVAAVDGVSFDVAPGEVVGFLGPNGAGKTTTLKLLAGLLHPSGGEARVLGAVPHRRERAFLRGITMVIDGHGQPPAARLGLPVGDSFEVQRARLRRAVDGAPSSPTCWSSGRCSASRCASARWASG